MKAGPEIRSLISFERLNLNDDDYPVPGPFDVILCRNVLIYFNKESRKRVIDRLLDRLAPDGYFLLGRSETLSGVTDRIQGVSPSVYIHKQEQGGC
jgi:chemotaxis protein methyltransferase CheR